MAANVLQLWSVDDDWKDVMDTQERRRRQNRVHQRTYRTKKHLRRMNASSGAVSVSGETHVERPSTIVAKEDDRNSRDLPATLQLIRCPSVIEKILFFQASTSANWNLGCVSLMDIPIVTRLNAFDALVRNAFILHIPAESLESEEDCSPFTVGPLVSNYPADLAPTHLQRTILHHPWLDLLPIPAMRDNIIRGIQEGIYDEEQLSQDLICELLNFEAIDSAPLMIWGDSWDISGWEFSPGFFARWGSLLQGCPEVLQATNAWRAKRNEKLLELSIDT